MKRIRHTWRMPLVWDIFHASKNAEGGQLTWCCTTEKYGRDHSFLFLKKNLMKIFFFNFENLNFSKELKILNFFFFFEKFGNLEFFHGIENFDFFSRSWKLWLIDFFFFEKFGNLEFFQGIENFDWWFFFFLKAT